jgi:hypothetical protein
LTVSQPDRRAFAARRNANLPIERPFVTCASAGVGVSKAFEVGALLARADVALSEGVVSGLPFSEG